MNLTKKQKEVLDFITGHIERESVSPSYSEIQKHFGLKSKGSVQDYIRYIKQAGFLKDNKNSRGLELASMPEPMIQIPVLGEVAAGQPLDVGDDQGQDLIAVPESMAYKGKCYALNVKGNSMIEDCIMDGDIIVVRSQRVAKSGETVVALVDGAATVKRYHKKNKQIELHPANEALKPIIVRGGDFKIQGIVVGLIRSYKY
jgi:SOS regulatory protein LexA